MKKNYLYGVLFLIASSAYAAGYDVSPPAPTIFDGFYVNAGLGSINSVTKNKQSLDIFVPLALHSTFNFSPTENDNKFAGELGFGFSRVFPQEVYAALEARGGVQRVGENFSFSSREILSSNLTFVSRSKVKLKNDPGLIVKLGKLIGKKTVLYGLLGGTRGSFDISSSTGYQQTLGGETINLVVSEHKSSHKGGWIVGAGVERYVMDNLGFGLEYKFTNYGKLNFPGSLSSSAISTPGSAISGTLTAANKFRFRTNTVMFKVNYHIAT